VDFSFSCGDLSKEKKKKLVNKEYVRQKSEIFDLGNITPELRPFVITFSIVQALITCNYQSFCNGSSTVIIQWPKPVTNQSEPLNPFKNFFIFFFFPCFYFELVLTLTVLPT